MSLCTREGNLDDEKEWLPLPNLTQKTWNTVDAAGTAWKELDTRLPELVSGWGTGGLIFYDSGYFLLMGGLLSDNS